MRYAIRFDKAINQLVPHYIGGRKLILYLQALMKPLQVLNDEFVEYAKETRIETSMTSQIIMFEWYLNRKLSKYFLNGGAITLHNSGQLGIPIYHQNAKIPKEDNVLLHHESESQNKTAFYHQGEQTEESTSSFIVSSPAINNKIISQDKYIAMLSFYIDKYRLAGKSYIIKFNK